MTALHKRAGSLACILTAGLTGLAVLLHFFPKFPNHNAANMGLYFAGFIVLPLALTALYGVQARQVGILGLVAFSLAMVGNMLTLIPLFLSVAQAAGSEEAHIVWMFALSDLPLSLVGIFLLLTGLLLFGIASMYGGVLPLAAGLLLSLGAVLDLPSELVGSLFFLWPVSVALMCLSLTWNAWALWKLAVTADEQTSTAVHPVQRFG